MTKNTKYILWTTISETTDNKVLHLKSDNIFTFEERLTTANTCQLKFSR